MTKLTTTAAISCHLIILVNLGYFVSIYQDENYRVPLMIIIIIYFLQSCSRIQVLFKFKIINESSLIH